MTLKKPLMNLFYTLLAPKNDLNHVLSVEKTAVTIESMVLEIAAKQLKLSLWPRYSILL